MKRAFFAAALFASAFAASAQLYNDGSVHYFLPAGYTKADIGAVKHPYDENNKMYVTCVIERDDTLFLTTFGTFIMDVNRDRRKYVAALERVIREAPDRVFSKYVYNPEKSTPRNKVFSQSVPYSFCGYTANLALRTDGGRLLYWKDGYEDNRECYDSISVESLLPPEANLDFLK